MTTQEPHPHALESLLTDLVPGFIPEISIAEQPGQDADYQGPGAHSASWGIGAAPRSVTSGAPTRDSNLAVLMAASTAPVTSATTVLGGYPTGASTASLGDRMRPSGKTATTKRNLMSLLELEADVDLTADWTDAEDAETTHPPRSKPTSLLGKEYPDRARSQQRAKLRSPRWDAAESSGEGGVEDGRRLGAVTVASASASVPGLIAAKRRLNAERRRINESLKAEEDRLDAAITEACGPGRTRVRVEERHRDRTYNTDDDRERSLDEIGGQRAGATEGGEQTQSGLNPRRIRCNRNRSATPRDSDVETRRGRHRSSFEDAVTTVPRRISRNRGRNPGDDDGDDGESGRERACARERGRRRNRIQRRSSSSNSSHSQERNRRRIRPREFNGTGSFETFYEHFQVCAQYNRWREVDKLAHLKSALTGDAGQLLWDMPASDTDTVAKLVKLLRNRFGGAKQADKFRMELRLRRRQADETLSKLHQDIRRLMALAHPTLKADEREVIACDYFIDALDDPDFALKVRERTPTTLDDALRISLQLEAWARDAQRQRGERQSTPQSAPHSKNSKTRIVNVVDVADDVNRDVSSLDAVNQKLDQLLCASRNVNPKPQSQFGIKTEPKCECKRQPGLEQQPQSFQRRKRGGSTPNLVRFCYNCGNPGHIRRNCPFPRPQPNVCQSIPSYMSHPVSPPQPTSYSYSYDAVPPHDDAFSPSYAPQPQPLQSTAYQPSVSSYLASFASHPPQPTASHAQSKSIPSTRGLKGLDQDAVYIVMGLGKREHPCLLDSGCEKTLVPLAVATSMRRAYLRQTSYKLTCANDTTIDVVGEITLPLVLQGRCIPTPALATPDVEEIMLGAEWLTKHRCLWDFANKCIYVDGGSAAPLTTRRNAQCRRIFVQEHAVLPPKQEIDVIGRTTLQNAYRIRTPHIVEPHALGSGLYVGRTLLGEGLHDLRVRVVNTTSEPQHLNVGKCLGKLTPVEIVDPATEVEAGSEAAPAHPDAVPVFAFETESAPHPDVIDPLLDQLPDGLTANQRFRVEQLLRSYDDVFSKGEFDMGRTHLAEHYIDTGDSRPIRQGLRRHPIAHLEEIDRQVDELVTHDYVEPAASPWASNVLLVRKKDGSYRLCVDYRSLNAVTYKDAYPLPHIDTCLGTMNGASWFSTIDLRSGYHNIPIKENDKDKTAFVTRRGSFRYKVLPFGLSTAPSVFQRLMDLVLCGLTYVTCLVYLDDIIVYAPDFDTHLTRLQEVFERLRAANLKVHPGKSCFLQQKVDFLGHVLSAKGIEVQDAKIATIRDWPSPRNLRELRSFLGLSSYYRRFVPQFASVAAPLHRLQNKNVTFEWGAREEDAFQELKRRLMTTPILGMPTDEGTYYLDTDASETGLGAVLSQDQGGAEVVIAYASRTLTKSEVNYDVTKRELLAVVYGLKNFRQYLLGRRFIIRTDHQALQWFRRTPEPMGQLARWLAFIEQYNFDIVHRPGMRHGNADALSRRPDANACIRGTTVTESNTSASAPESALDDDTHVKRVPISAGEHPEDADKHTPTMAEMQLNDPEIGILIKMRLQNTHPSVESFVAQSDAAKELLGHWSHLEVHDGLVYRRWTPKKEMRYCSC